MHDGKGKETVKGAVVGCSGSVSTVFFASLGQASRKAYDVFVRFENQAVCITGVGAPRKSLNVEMYDELGYYPLQLYSQWQVVPWNCPEIAESPIPWPSLCKMKQLPNWSFVSSKAQVYEKTDEGMQVVVGDTVASVHVRNQVLDLSQVAEGDTIEAHFAIVSQKFENLALDQGCIVSIRRGSGVCTSPSKLRRAF